MKESDLHEALSKRDAGRVAQYFHHRRRPSTGLDAPLRPSSTVAEAFLSNTHPADTTRGDDGSGRKLLRKNLEIALLSPTGYELPWKALHLVLQQRPLPPSSSADNRDDETTTIQDIVMSIQTFLQQVAAEWKGSSREGRSDARTSLGGSRGDDTLEEEDDDTTPRTWLRRMVQAVLPTTSPSSSSPPQAAIIYVPVLSTILSLAKSQDAEFYHALIQQHVLANMHALKERPSSLGWNWMQPHVQTHVRRLVDQEDIDTVRTLLSPSSFTDVSDILQLHRLISDDGGSDDTETTTTTTSTHVSRAVQHDPIWQELVSDAYTRAYGTQAFATVHFDLTSSLVALSNDVLIKWLRWTLDREPKETTATSSPVVLRIVLAMALYEAWSCRNLASYRCQPTAATTTPHRETNMGPILWEQWSTRLFGESSSAVSSQGHYERGIKAVEFACSVTEGCHYMGQGILSCTPGHPNDSFWLTDAATIVWKSITAVTGDAGSSNHKRLTELCFEMAGSYLEATSGFDLVLFVLLIPMLYEASVVTNQRLILAKMRRGFAQDEPPEGMLRLFCASLRFMVQRESPDKDIIWRCLSPMLRQNMSLDVWGDLAQALMGNTRTESEMASLCHKWIARPAPSCVTRRGPDRTDAPGFFQRGLKILAILLVHGSVPVRMDSLCFLRSVLDGSTRLPPSFRIQLYDCMWGILYDSSEIDTFVLETIFRHASRGLFRMWKCCKERRAEMKGHFSVFLQEAVSIARLLTRVLGSAKNRSDSELLVESMWPYDTFLDALFAALLEWQGEENDSLLNTKVLSSRTLDVSNNDPHIAAAIASLSWVYQNVLVDTKIMDVKGAPALEAWEQAAPHKVAHDDTMPRLLCSVSKDSVNSTARLDIAELSLSERLWRDKASDHYKSFVLALSSLILSSESKAGIRWQDEYRLDAMLNVLDRPLLSEVFGDFSTQNMTTEQIDRILALSLFACRQIQSMDLAHASDDTVLQRIMILYDTFCSEERVADMLSHLECAVGKEGSNSFKGRVIDLNGREQLDASVRKFRTDLIQALSTFFELLANESALTSVSWREHLQALVRALLRDFKMGLHCGSGGVDTDLCIAFVNCIEMIHNNLGRYDSAWISQLCHETLEHTEGILQVINLNNADVVDCFLSLTANSLPAIVKSSFRECTIKNAPVSGIHRDHERISSICDDLYELCLEYNRKRLNPLEELHASNKSTLVSAPKPKVGNAVGSLQTKSTKASGSGILLPSLVTLFGSDQTWGWAFKAALESYRDALYFAVQDSRTVFIANGSRLVFARTYFGEMKTIVCNILRTFEPNPVQKSKKSASSVVAVNLPSIVKDCLCEFLHQFFQTLTECLRLVKEVLQAESVMSVGYIEAVCILVAWLSFDEDICLMTRTWYEQEERTASRAGAKQSVVVTEASFIRDLAKLVEQIDEITEQLGSLGDVLSMASEKSVLKDRLTLWGDTKLVLKDICGEPFHFNERLEPRFRALRGRMLKVDKSVTDKTIPTKRKKRKSPSEPAVSHRSQLVEDWLQKDRDTGDGKMGDDTFADLEDFLVED